jgi:uncharacterized protein (TIGR02678 family)
MSPVVYKYYGYDNDLIYIKNFRSMMENDVAKYIDSNLHIHKNSAMIILQSGSYKDVFPNSRGISDIILQMSFLIRREFQETNINNTDNVDGIMDIPIEKFLSLVNKCKQLYSEGWSKFYREMSMNKLLEEVIFEMKNYQMIEVKNKDERVLILPLAGKITGQYPKDYNKRGDEYVQMENE